MPLILATRCGSISSSKNAWMRAAVTESWPQPAQSVDMRALVVAAREAEPVRREARMLDLGFAIVRHPSLPSSAWLMPSTTCCGVERQPAVVEDRAQLVLGHGRLEREQRPELRVAVLLDHERGVMLREELVDSGRRTGTRGSACSRAAARPRPGGRAPRGPPQSRRADRDHAMARAVPLSTIGCGTAWPALRTSGRSAVHDLDVLGGSPRCTRRTCCGRSRA